MSQKLQFYTNKNHINYIISLLNQLEIIILKFKIHKRQNHIFDNNKKQINFIS